ncbi:hypothetical protein [Actinorhabdospora filicis]|nr:hypothetical protein [Actinorhabdospora filicis]
MAVLAGLTIAGVATALLIGADDDAGAQGDDGPRAVTSEEADRLALTRFRNYEAGGRAVTITVPNTGGELTVTASVDFRAKSGYGTVQGNGRNTSSDGLIQWTLTTVRFHPEIDSAGPPPASGWSSRPLQTSGSALDTALSIVLGLGSDRPENALLLAQNGATWISRDELSGHRTDVMTGPNAHGTNDTSGTVRYWIADDGTMFRVQVAVASEPKPVLIDFDTHSYVPVQPVPSG